jgi:hypothetical protein
MKELAELTERLAKEIVKTENYRREVGKFLRELPQKKSNKTKKFLRKKLYFKLKS